MGRAAGRAPRNSAGQIPGPSSLCGLTVCLSSKSSLAALPRLEGQEEESLPPLARIRAARSPARRRGDAELDTATVTVPPREPRLLRGAVSAPLPALLSPETRPPQRGLSRWAPRPQRTLPCPAHVCRGRRCRPGTRTRPAAGPRGGGGGPCLVLTLPLTWPGAEAEARHPGGPWRGRPALGRPVLSLGAEPGSLPRPPPARLSTRGRVSSTPRAPRRPPRGLLPAGPVCLSSPTVFSRGCLTQVPFLVCRLCPWGCHGPEGEAGCGGQVVLWPSQHLVPVGQPPAGPVPLRAASGPGGDPRGGGGVSRLPAGGRGGSVSSRSQSTSQAVS